ncbi:hypothetical protein D5018_10055 [Parashewanella curva]|uniref:Uncharacterized protein n=1 Tax=Parashewanella curva TaxID=2338552 RepID=A0A3L8PYB5_9GAMM|nr:hypothetical protein [Parashewanella curva]RLV59809.1 hypothetical protein D5018_10055 [Parashewanella curva]
MATAKVSSSSLPQRVFRNDRVQAYSAHESLKDPAKRAKTFFNRLLFKFFNPICHPEARLVFIELIQESDPKRAIWYFLRLQQLADNNAQYLSFEPANDPNDSTSVSDSLSSHTDHMISCVFHVKPNPQFTGEKFFTVNAQFDHNFQDQVQEVFAEMEAELCVSKSYDSIPKGLKITDQTKLTALLTDLYKATTPHEVIRVLRNLNEVIEHFQFEIILLSSSKPSGKAQWQLKGVDRTPDKKRENKSYFEILPFMDAPEAVWKKEQKVSEFITNLKQARIIYPNKHSDVVTMIRSFTFTSDLQQKLWLKPKLVRALSGIEGANFRVLPHPLLTTPEGKTIQDQPMTLCIGEYQLTSDHETAVLAEKHVPQMFDSSISKANSPQLIRENPAIEKVDLALKNKRIAIRGISSVMGYLETLTSPDEDISMLVIAKDGLNSYLKSRDVEPAFSSRVITKNNIPHTVYECCIEGTDPIELVCCKGTEEDHLQRIQAQEKAEKEKALQITKRAQFIDDCINKLQDAAIAFHQSSPKAGHPLSLLEKEKIKEQCIRRIKEEGAAAEQKAYLQSLAKLVVYNPQKLTNHALQAIGEFTQCQHHSIHRLRTLEKQIELPAECIFQSDAEVEAMFENKDGVLRNLYDVGAQAAIKVLCSSASSMEQRLESINSIQTGKQQLSRKPEDITVVLTPKCHILPETEHSPECKQLFIVIEVIAHTLGLCTPLCIIPVLPDSAEHSWLTTNHPELAQHARLSQTVEKIYSAQQQLAKIQSEIKHIEHTLSHQEAELKLKQNAWKLANHDQIKASELTSKQLSEYWPKYQDQLTEIKDSQLTVEPICDAIVAKANQRHQEIFAPLANLNIDELKQENFYQLKQMAEEHIEQLRQTRALRIATLKEQGVDLKQLTVQWMSTTEKALLVKLSRVKIQLDKAEAQDSSEATLNAIKALYQQLVIAESKSNQVPKVIEEFKQLFNSTTQELQQISWITAESLISQITNTNDATLPTTYLDLTERFKQFKFMAQLLSHIEILHRCMKLGEEKLVLPQPWHNLKQLHLQILGTVLNITKLMKRHREAVEQDARLSTIETDSLAQKKTQLEKEKEYQIEQIELLKLQAESEAVKQNQSNTEQLVRLRNVLNQKVDKAVGHDLEFTPSDFYKQLGQEYDPILAPAYVV